MKEMNENTFEAQYDLTKKSRLRKFYEGNKILIFSTILIFVIIFSSLYFYIDKKNKKRILLSENYVQAKIYLENGKKEEAINILKKVIFADDPVYSSLSFFILMDLNLITDYEELSSLFTHLLKNNKFEKEEKNLLIYKKALLNSNFKNESSLLEDIKPLLNEESYWKPHALLLLGDYFISKNEHLKAREFYINVLSIKNLHQNLYDKAKGKLELMANE